MFTFSATTKNGSQGKKGEEQRDERTFSSYTSRMLVDVDVDVDGTSYGLGWSHLNALCVPHRVEAPCPDDDAEARCI